MLGGRLNERLLLQRLRSGDPAAAQRFVSDRYERIYRLLQHLTNSPDAADDLAQQTFVRAWQALSTFRGDASLNTWLHRIAYREYIQWLRAGRKDDSDSMTEAMPASERADLADGVALRTAIDTLHPEQRDAFLLYHVQGLSVGEIAAIVEAPAGTIKYRLFAARQHLRRELSEPDAAFPPSPAAIAMMTAGSPAPCDATPGATS